MAKGGIQTTGTKEWVAALTRTVRQMEINSEGELLMLGRVAEQTIRSKAPRATGALAESVKAEGGEDAKGPYVEISVEPFY